MYWLGAYVGITGILGGFMLSEASGEPTSAWIWLARLAVLLSWPVWAGAMVVLVFFAFLSGCG